MLGYGDFWGANVVLIVVDKGGSAIQYSESGSGGAEQTLTCNSVVFTAGQGRQLWIKTPKAGKLYYSTGTLISHVTTLNTKVQVLSADWSASHKNYLYWNFD